MDVQIKRDETKPYPKLGFTHRVFELEAGNLPVTVILVTGVREYVAVVVQNASNRAWRGMGKEYPTLAAALGRYKDARVVAMLNVAADLVAATMAEV